MRWTSVLIASLGLALAAPVSSVVPATAAAAEVASAAPLDASTLGSAQAKLAFRLIEQMSRDAREPNITVSPASLAAVLALLDLGANAEMRATLAKTLALDGADAAAATRLAALRASVKAISVGGGAFTSANALVFDPATPPFPKIAAALADLGAKVDVERLDDPATLKQINDWVNARTNGLIPTIIERMPSEAGLVALNAMHFKERWKEAFDPAATKPSAFHPVGAAAAQVAMMHKSDARLRVRRQGPFAAVELPYATERFRMVLVTGTEKPLRASELAPAAGWLAGDGFTDRPAALAMPRLSLSGRADLLGPLDALGLARGRASRGALAGLSPASLVIAQVLQRTELRLDEAGTEAAAATAVTTIRSTASDFVRITLDKPFLFALRDVESGLVLLAGYVGLPR
jgi:serpin B